MTEKTTEDARLIDLKLVEERVRRETTVNLRLDNLEAHAKNLNGQIARGADAIERVEASFIELRNDLKEQRAIDMALRKENEKRTKRLQIYANIVIAIVALATLMIHFI